MDLPRGFEGEGDNYFQFVLSGSQVAELGINLTRSGIALLSPAEVFHQVRCLELWNPPLGDLLLRPCALPSYCEYLNLVSTKIYHHPSV